MTTNTALGVGAASVPLLGATAAASFTSLTPMTSLTILVSLTSITSLSSVLQVAAGPEQYAATAVIAVAYVAFLYGLYRAGRGLKDRYDDDVVEILQALATTVGAIAASLAIAVVWELYGEVEGAYQQFFIEPVTAIMILVTFVAVVVTYTLTRITKRLVKYASGRIEVTPHQRELIHHLVQLVLFFCLAAFIFALWEFDPTNLLLGAGVLGIVLGFAARKTLSGVLAGFVILFSRPFEVGDWIAVDDREGVVTEITVYNTEIRTFNEEHVIVPNDTLTENEVVNYSKTSRLRLETEVGVDYADDPAEASAVAVAAMENCESVADAPNPDVVLDSFADSAVVLRLRYWIDRPTIALALQAQNEVVEAVKRAFDEAEIKIPYPQRELTGREELGGLRTATDAAAESGAEQEIDRSDTGGDRRAEGEPAAVSEPVERRHGDGHREDDAGDSEAEPGDHDDREAEAADDRTDQEYQADGRVAPDEPVDRLEEGAGEGP